MNRAMRVLVSLIFMLSPLLASEHAGLDNKTRDFGIALGINEYQVKDRVLNNIRHRGLSPTALGAAWDISSVGTLQRYELLLMVNLLASRYDPERSSYAISSSFRYRLLKRFPGTVAGFRYALGGGLGGDHDLVYYSKWDDCRTYWLTSYHLTINGRLDRELTGNTGYWLEAGLPVVALVSRPPERFLDKMGRPDLPGLLGELHDDLRITSIHEHFLGKVKLGFTVRRPAGSRLDLFWQLKYARSSMPYSRTIDIVTHAAGVQYYF